EYVLLVRGVRAISVAHAEMTGGEVQRITGKDVSRPRSGTARQNDGINSLAAIISDLRADQRSVGGSAVWIVASGHVHFDVAKAAFCQVCFQRCESFVSFHIGH